MKKLIPLAITALLFGSCVAKKHLTYSRNETANLRVDSARLANENTSLKNDISGLNSKVDSLNHQNSLLAQQSASQQTKLTQNQQKLQQLQDLLNQQRQQSEELKNKMAEALKGFNSNELSVMQKNGKVYVSLSENLLFPSGSAVVNKKGVDALSKLAAVLNLNNDVAINIEGHTDSIPIKGKYTDNWDLSTARANAIVRILVDNYRVDPIRVMASGHSRFDPVDTNSTPEGRAKNRRTEIILTPKLEEMYKLLES